MAPTELVSIPDDGRNLDAFNPEQSESEATVPLMVVVNAGAPLHPAVRPAPFSRVEAAQSRRARRRWPTSTLSQSRAAMRHAGGHVERAAAGVVGYGLALSVLIALRCDSFAHLVGRAARGGSRSTRHVGLAMARLFTLGLRKAISGGALASRHTISAIRHDGAIARQHATWLHRNCASAIHGMADAWRTRRRAWRAQRAEESAIRHLESEGSLVAIGLAVVVIGYGTLFVISWRHPATTVSTFAVATVHPAFVETTTAGTTHPPVVVAPIPPDRAVDMRPRVRVMNASTLNTIWRRNDTRSLQQAFASLRRETLAFHRCSVKMTAADRAVAQCDGVAGFVGADSEGAPPRATWTLDFRRTGDRWAIQRVRTR